MTIDLRELERASILRHMNGIVISQNGSRGGDPPVGFIVEWDCTKHGHLFVPPERKCRICPTEVRR